MQGRPVPQLTTNWEGPAAPAASAPRLADLTKLTADPERPRRVRTKAVWPWPPVLISVVMIVIGCRQLWCTRPHIHPTADVLSPLPRPGC
jgi:hypothetical protein